MDTYINSKQQKISENVTLNEVVKTILQKDYEDLGAKFNVLMTDRIKFQKRGYVEKYEIEEEDLEDFIEVGEFEVTFFTI